MSARVCFDDDIRWGPTSSKLSQLDVWWGTPAYVMQAVFLVVSAGNQQAQSSWKGRERRGFSASKYSSAARYVVLDREVVVTP